MDARRRDVLKLAVLASLAGCAEGPRPASTRAASPGDGKGTLRTRPLFTLRLTAADVQDVGPGPHGTRISLPVTGGTFEGDRLRGTVLPAGSVWTVKRADGSRVVDVRLTLQTDDQALVALTLSGLREDAATRAPGYRTVGHFQTASSKYAFLNRLLAVGSGDLRREGSGHLVEELL